MPQGKTLFPDLHLCGWVDLQHLPQGIGEGFAKLPQTGKAGSELLMERRPGDDLRPTLWHSTQTGSQPDVGIQTGGAVSQGADCAMIERHSMTLNISEKLV
jgi:hypothetical protein